MADSRWDRDTVRRLAEELAKIASLPSNGEKAELYRRLNRLERVKPMVVIREVPWHEMNTGDELKLQTSDTFYRGLEWWLRVTIYQWKHLQGDMIVEPKVFSSLVIHDTGFGIQEEAETAKTDQTNGVVSRHFRPQIRGAEDIDKIKTPRITFDAEASEQNYQRLVDAFGGILTVEKQGMAGYWFNPWDMLIMWWGVQEAMIDLIERPELVHAAMDRLVSAHLCKLDQFEELNLLALNNGNQIVASGGLGYTDELPRSPFDPVHVRAKDLWGCATAQIFSDISPEMHEEFALQYENRWLKRFGLNYYGCCEPLHDKIDMLSSVPNLRKISISPWADVEKAVEKIGTQYVLSLKPNPAIFAFDVWDPGHARRELRGLLERTKDCVVEVILKDISTVRYEPRRLWEWAQIARQETERFA